MSRTDRKPVWLSPEVHQELKKQAGAEYTSMVLLIKKMLDERKQEAA